MVDKKVKFQPAEFCIKVDKNGKEIHPELLAKNVASKVHWREAEEALAEVLLGLHIDRDSMKSSRVSGWQHVSTVIVCAQDDILRWRREFLDHKTADDTPDPWPNTRTAARVCFFCCEVLSVCVCLCSCVNSGAWQLEETKKKLLVEFSSLRAMEVGVFSCFMT